MYNRIILIGRLTADPVLKYTPQGTAVATFTLAVNRRFNRDETDFINIVTWRSLAEHCAQYLSKGQQTALEGRLQIRSYEGKDGVRRTVAEVIADDVRFLGKAGAGTSSAGGNSSNGYGQDMGGRADDWDNLGHEVRVDEINTSSQEPDDDLPF
jgi:single-strand DNA-binding protein